MTRDELVTALQNVETSLRSAEVQTFFQTRPTPERDRLVSFRQKLAVLIGTLRNAELAKIAQKLNELSDALEAAIGDVEGRLDALNDAVAILNTLSDLLGLTARVAALAGA